jgi:hypothetical protein
MGRLKEEFRSGTRDFTPRRVLDGKIKATMALGYGAVVGRVGRIELASGILAGIACPCLFQLLIGYWMCYNDSRRLTSSLSPPPSARPLSGSLLGH